MQVFHVDICFHFSWVYVYQGWNCWVVCLAFWGTAIQHSKVIIVHILKNVRGEKYSIIFTIYNQIGSQYISYIYYLYSIFTVCIVLMIDNQVFTVSVAFPSFLKFQVSLWNHFPSYIPSPHQKNPPFKIGLLAIRSLGFPWMLLLTSRFYALRWTCSFLPSCFWSYNPEQAYPKG